MNILRTATYWTAWPALLAACVGGMAAGFAMGWPVVAFFLTYGALAAALLLLQGWIPHEPAWLPADGQLAADLGHTVLSTAAVQGLLVFGGTIGLSLGASALTAPAAGIWPVGWPLAGQVALGLVVLEFALYWAHRLAHEWPALWQFHAIHHSVAKLWAVNSGRFHFVDAIKSVLPGIALLVALGAPADVLTWLSAIGAYVGILTHCNVEMRFGVLSAVFNTPELHRWHHSRDLAEGNKNYGETLMVWDWVFGTWFNAGRRPPADIGVAEAVPVEFLRQLAWPFARLVGRRGVVSDGLVDGVVGDSVAQGGAR